jgi:hypothetical protein
MLFCFANSAEEDYLVLDYARAELDLSGLKQLQAFACLPAVLQPEGRQVAVLPPTYPAIDAAGPGRRVFQITLQLNRPLTPNQIDYLLASAKLLTHLNGKWTIDSSKDKVEFYWMVLPAHYPERRKLFAWPCASTSSEYNKCWHDKVEQYVLEVSMEGPIPSKYK